MSNPIYGIDKTNKGLAEVIPGKIMQVELTGKRSNTGQSTYGIEYYATHAVSGYGSTRKNIIVLQCMVKFDGFSTMFEVRSNMPQTSTNFDGYVYVSSNGDIRVGVRTENNNYASSASFVLTYLVIG